jgi:hypothetical protein
MCKSRLDGPFKRTMSRDIFYLNLNQYFLYKRPYFLLLGFLGEKKYIYRFAFFYGNTNSEDCSESRIKISVQASFCAIGRFYPVFTPYWMQAREIRENLHFIGGFRKNFQNRRRLSEQLVRVIGGYKKAGTPMYATTIYITLSKFIFLTPLVSRCTMPLRKIFFRLFKIIPYHAHRQINDKAAVSNNFTSKGRLSLEHLFLLENLYKP